MVTLKISILILTTNNVKASRFSGSVVSHFPDKTVILNCLKALCQNQAQYTTISFI